MLVELMPWQPLLCSWRLTKQWSFTKKHFICVHATEVQSSHLLSPLSAPVTQPSSQLPQIPLFLMEFILSGSKYITSIIHRSSQEHFACTCNQLNASVLKFSNYCNLKLRKREPFPCPSVGECSTAWMAQNPHLFKLFLMPRQAGEGKWKQHG